jgi:hypothetical protein
MHRGSFLFVLDRMQIRASSEPRACQHPQFEFVVGISFCLSILLCGTDVLGVEDNGFYGIRWGTKLSEVADLRLIEPSDRIETYELKRSSPQLGNAKIDKLQFVAIEGEFARILIRYSGEQNHKEMMAYLQSQFGSIERIPGSMMRGLNQQFTWRTPETEVNVTYQSFQERGTVFIESRTLAPRFNDVLPESAY